MGSQAEPLRQTLSETRAGTGILVDARWLDEDGNRGVLGLARVAREVVHRLPSLERLERGPRLLHPFEPAWLTAVLAKRKPRLFYSPGFNVPPTSPVPFVQTVFDLIHLRVPEFAGAKRRLYYRAVVRPAMGRARAVLTGSEHSRTELIEWSGADPDRIVVIGSAAAAHFTPDGGVFEPGFPYLLYVGNQKPHKNLVRLVQAFARSRERGGLRLVLTGAPNRELVSVARGERLDERLVFLGSVPDERLPDVYRGAVAFVFPSLYEGFGLPPLEAMACGTPVVSSAATALAEVVGGAAVVVDPLAIDSIADGIDEVVRDERLRAELRERGIARARHFSWDRAADITWQTLQRSLAEE
jgi:glycosyltransferase involved in cell wall biosynthesis